MDQLAERHSTPVSAGTSRVREVLFVRQSDHVVDAARARVRLDAHMAFPVPVTSALTGATARQLGYWRRATPADPPLLVPHTKRGGRFIYSWADVVALRTVVYLRQEKSLPKIRRAVETLRALEADQWEHLSQYVLVSTPLTIIVKTPTGQILDLEWKPGTVLDETLMADVMGPFQTRDGRDVPPLERPRPLLTVHADVLGGYPVVAESRVPFDVVATLADEGAAPAEIVELYPSVDPLGVPDAQDFARQVAAAV
jgi:uncharacterized protein (DUF433 family)